MTFHVSFEFTGSSEKDSEASIKKTEQASSKSNKKCQKDEKDLKLSLEINVLKKLLSVQLVI